MQERPVITSKTTREELDTIAIELKLDPTQAANKADLQELIEAEWKRRDEELEMKFHRGVNEDGSPCTPDNPCYTCRLEAAAPRDDQGLRLDGPTLEEYVNAGYAAESYPPKGYAKRDTPYVVDDVTRLDTAVEVPQQKVQFPPLEEIQAEQAQRFNPNRKW